MEDITMNSHDHIHARMIGIYDLFARKANHVLGSCYAITNLSEPLDLYRVFLCLQQRDWAGLLNESRRFFPLSGADISAYLITGRG